MKRRQKIGSVLGAIFLIIFFTILYNTKNWLFWVLIFVGAVVAIAVGLPLAIKANGQFAEETTRIPARKQPKSALNASIQNDIRIMNECLQFMNTSTNIETVINRFNDLLNVLNRLSSYENNPAVSFLSELPSSALTRMHKEKPRIFNAAIQRAYDNMIERAAALKTESGRKNRQLKFFDLLMSHTLDFPSETNDFIGSFINDRINEPV